MHVTGTDWLVIAVIIDSAVTLFVGWRLERAAKIHTAKAAESVKPVIDNSISAAIAQTIPLVVNLLNAKLEEMNGITRTESSSGPTAIPITKPKRQSINTGT